jgi:hypothetical protein
MVSSVNGCDGWSYDWWGYNKAEDSIQGGAGLQGNKVQDSVVRVVLKMTATIDQKGVVYCGSKTGWSELAEKLGCDYYDSDIKGEKRGKEVLEQWASGLGGNG